MTTAPPEVLGAWGLGDAEVEVLAGGLINATFKISRGGAPTGVLQRLHPVFGPAVNLDLEAVTAHLAARGLVTPRLVRTLAGQPWVEHGGATWRVLTWVDGVTVHRVPEVRWAEAGGALVGTFHRAVADLEHTYAFARAGVHDTAAHLQRLTHEVGQAVEGEATDIGQAILTAATALPPLPVLPGRHCHGDLKLSNLLFSPAPPEGIALVDLDTLGLSTMAFELGDAMRSWCNPHGEDAGQVTFDLPIFAAAIGGFRANADPLLSEAERTAIVTGLETVCIELAARFAVDVFRDDYFGWDATRFSSRRAHNLVRARGQLALGLAVRAARAAALDIVHTRV